MYYFETLATLLITRQLAQNFVEICVPFLAEKWRLFLLAYKSTGGRFEASVNLIANNVENIFSLTTRDSGSHVGNCVRNRKRGRENEEVEQVESFVQNSSGMQIRKNNYSNSITVFFKR